MVPRDAGTAPVRELFQVLARSGASSYHADADEVAVRALRAIDRGWPAVYAPGVWRGILLVIRALSRAVLRRVEF